MQKKLGPWRRQVGGLGQTSSMGLGVLVLFVKKLDQLMNEKVISKLCALRLREGESNIPPLHRTPTEALKTW